MKKYNDNILDKKKYRELKEQKKKELRMRKKGK